MVFINVCSEQEKVMLSSIEKQYNNLVLYYSRHILPNQKEAPEMVSYRLANFIFIFFIYWYIFYLLVYCINSTDQQHKTERSSLQR